MIQIKGFAVKKSKIIVKIKNKILFLHNLIKKALLALWFLTVEELSRCSLPTNRAMRRPFYGGIELLWMAPRSF